MARKAGLASGVEVAKITVRVSPDTKEFRRELKADLDEIERSLKAKIDVEPDMDGFRQEVKAKTEGMEAKVKVKADVDKNQTKQTAKGFSKLFNDFATAGPGFGSGINPGGYALIATGVLYAALPIIGLITSALLALPGLVSLIGAPIAAITLGLDGFAKAAEKIKPQFEQLKKTMSDAAESQFTPVLKNLADTVFPLLERSLPNVTKGLANIAQGVVDTFNKPENANKFENSINRIATALSAMTPGFQGFTSGLIGLIDQFTLKLPAISTWFNDIGNRFNNWVQQISADGTLGSAFDGLGNTIRTIVDLIGDLGQKGIEFLGKPENLDKVKSTFEGISKAISGIASASGKFFELLDRIENSNLNRNLEDNGAAAAFGLPNDKNSFWENLFGKTPQKDPFADSRDGARQAATEYDKAKDSLGQLFGLTANPPPPPPPDKNPLTAVLNPSGAGGGKPGEDPAAPPVVKPPDTGPAQAKLSEYQGFVDNVTAQVRGALQQATSGESLPAPDFSTFKAAWAELPGFVTAQIGTMSIAAMGALNGIVNAFVTAGGNINTEVASWPGKIGAALSGLSGVGSSAGAALGQGLLSGMQSQEGAILAYAGSLAGKIAAVKGPIEKDKVVLVPAGQALMQGLGKGMEDGFQPVLDQASAMAAKVADAFSAGNVDPTTALAGFSPDEIKRMEKALTLQTKILDNQAKALEYQGKMNKDDGLKARAKAIRDQSDQLKLQKDMLDTAKEFSDTSEDGQGDVLTKAVGNLMSSPVNFAKATGKQFLSDIGISGDGVIGKALTEGVKYIFQIGSVDEALSIKDRTESKEKLAITGRGGV